MHVASTGKHVLKKSPKLATHTTQCMAMLRKVHCVPANGSASHPPGAARHDAHFEAWETCENTTLSPTTGKGAFSGKKPPPNPFSLLVSFSPPRTFFGPRRGALSGPFQGPKTALPRNATRTGGHLKRAPVNAQVSGGFCAKRDRETWKALRFLQKRAWNRTFLGHVLVKEFNTRNGPEVSGFTLLCVSPARHAPDTGQFRRTDARRAGETRFMKKRSRWGFGHPVSGGFPAPNH